MIPFGDLKLTKALCRLILLLPFFSVVVATPILGTDLITGNDGLQYHSRDAQNFYLRIMPLGASITRGDPSQNDGRGYRKYVRDKLRSRGWLVNMVGSNKWGKDFADNDNEGWPGFVIGPSDGQTDTAKPSSLHVKAKAMVPKYKPNLILVNVGTNDAIGNIDLDNAGSRMEAFLNTLFDSSPGVVVILSTLLPHGEHDDRVVYINQQYRDLEVKFRYAGRKIQLADMHDGFITKDDVFDNTHPTLLGSTKMASVWHTAILEIEGRSNWLQPPSSDVDFKDGSDGNTCDKLYDSGSSDPRSGQQVLTAASADIHDDGTYVHSSTSVGYIAFLDKPTTNEPERRPRLYAAQMVSLGGAARGGERDELIYIDGDSSNAKMWLNVNEGQFNFDETINLNMKPTCLTRGIRFGDVNNDGLDDFICIAPNGQISVAINDGQNPPNFEEVGLFKSAEPGYLQANVRLGDIDGDGRLDYCVIDDNRDIYCWRNGGIQHDRAEYWQSLGRVFSSEGKDLGNMGIEAMRFVDINGDFRSDVLWVDDTGKVTTWINQRGTDKSLVPYWRPAGVTHAGTGSKLGGWSEIIFGRLYSDRLSDYMFLSDGTYQTVQAWKSTGKGGRHQKGDGAHWGDMTGTGNDDYVWIDPDGNIDVFVNQNTPPNTDKYDNGGWVGTGFILSTGMTRKALHIGDWNGDGKADVIGVDQKTGALTVWITSYDSGSKKFSFSKQTSSQTYCKEGWGVGVFDLGHRFSDITGSGCVDYLCLKLDGLTTAWLNDCKPGLFDLRDVGQVKFAEPAKDRANIRFADVNGDGLADYMWVDKFDGDASVWINDGEKPEADRPNHGGSKFGWLTKGPVYHGTARGANMHYPNLGGVGRADMVQVDATTAHGWVWYNSCSGGGGGGDDGGIVPRDPNLPQYLPVLFCPWPTCYFSDNELGCDIDPYADSDSDEDRCDDETLLTRNLFTDTSSSTEISNLTERSSLGEPRGSKPPSKISWTYLGITYQLVVLFRRWPGASVLHNPTRGPPASTSAFSMKTDCITTEIEVRDRAGMTSHYVSATYDTEHNPDVQFIRDLIYTLGTAILPSGEPTTNGHVPGRALERYWNDNTIFDTSLPQAGSSSAKCVNTPGKYFIDRVGSQSHRAPFFLCERNLNQMKGRVFNINSRDGEPTNPMSQDRFDRLLDEAMGNSVTAQSELFENLRQVVGVFRYLNHTEVRTTLRNNIQELQLAADRISLLDPELAQVGPIFGEFISDWYSHAAHTARVWLSDHIISIEGRLVAAEQAGNLPTNAAQLRQMLDVLFDGLKYIELPL